MELLFLLAFTLHNLEEALWLPGWSKYVGKQYVQVSNRGFHFALMVLTTAGYFIAFLFLLFGQSGGFFRYVFLGFVLMMVINSIFPHLLATVIFKRYAPGTLTGVMLNLPVGLAVIADGVAGGMKVYLIIIVGLVFTFLTSTAMRPLFRLGNKLIDDE